MNLLKKTMIATVGLAMCATLFAGCAKKNDASATPLEKELSQKGKIIVGTSPDYPPYESLNTAGQVEGFDVDMMAEIGKYISEAGNNVTIEFKSMDFDTIVTAVQAGQVDVGVSAFTYDPDRDVLFSTPYLVSKQVIVVTKESGVKTAEDLSGKKIGAGLGTTGEQAAKDSIKDSKVSSPGNYNIMFEALKNGALDAVVCDGLVAENFAKANDFVILEEPLITEENSIIIKKGNEELAKNVNDAVDKFKQSPQYTELQKKWGIIAE